MMNQNRELTDSVSCPTMEIHVRRMGLESKNRFSGEMIE